MTAQSHNVLLDSFVIMKTITLQAPVLIEQFDAMQINSLNVVTQLETCFLWTWRVHTLCVTVTK